MGMKYIGTGFIHPFPARDLTDEEVNEFGEEALLATGLYEKESTEKPKSSRKSAHADIEKEGE